MNYLFTALVTKANGTTVDVAERFNPDVRAFVREVRETYPGAVKVQVFRGNSTGPDALVVEF